MYAETFNTRPWLETPAKWLRWAIQSLTSGKTDDARYNLQQFWNGLDAYKAKAAGPLDWAELYTLDGRSKEALADLYNAEIQAWINLQDGKWIKYGQATADANVKSFQTSRERELALAREYAEKARGLYAQARYPGNQQAGGNSATAGLKSAYLPTDRALQDKAAAAANESFFSASWLGIPLWTWLAGAAAIALLVTTGPTVLMARTALRKATA